MEREAEGRDIEEQKDIEAHRQAMKPRPVKKPVAHGDFGAKRDGSVPAHHRRRH